MKTRISEKRTVAAGEGELASEGGWWVKRKGTSKTRENHAKGG